MADFRVGRARFRLPLSALAPGLLALAALAGCSALPAPSVQAEAPQTNRAGVPLPETVLAQSDLTPDSDIRHGRLANGMFYAIRQNGTPASTAEVRLVFDAGSLDETDRQRGWAHYVEHMAFNGSTNVPEGEMVPLLEREGLAFGADTNASTSFENTSYRLSLPQSDPALLDTALMLMREVAGELQFDQGAVDRERGVLLAERRDRDNYQLEEALDRYGFETPDARYVERWAGGTAETLEAADGAGLKAFWAGHYRPENAALIVVGDIDPDAVETAIRARFADWSDGSPPPAPRDYGSVEFDRGAAEDIHIHPALSERLTVFRVAPAQNEADDSAERREAVLRQIGYDAINRRLKSLAREADAPFRSAGFGTGNVFRMARVTRLVVDSVDGQWERGLIAATSEYRRAMEQGFTRAEIAEQLAELDERYEQAAAGEATRSNEFFVNRISRWIAEGRVPTTGPEAAERYFAMRDEITPDAIMEALQEEAVPLGENALIRFRGRSEPEGGGPALRAAWEEALAAPLPEQAREEAQDFAYTDFGMPGDVVADEIEPIFGIRTIRFANNVRLNLKHTDINKDVVFVRMTLSGGRLLESREDPLAVELASRIPAGGLGAHDADQLETILAGKRVSFNFSAGTDGFTSTGSTRPDDLAMQLQLMAALITDPGWRAEPVARFRGMLPDYFARLKATPSSTFASEAGAIMSDDDPRFSQQPIDAYRALDFAQLRQIMQPVFDNAPIEIAIVGDIDEDRAIDLVAKTLGALPRREASFTPDAAALARSFTERRGTVVLRHQGEATQALVQKIWPTRDDSDAMLNTRMEILERMVRIALTDELRERLGQAYSPSASNAMSSIYPGYGSFTIRAQVDADAIAAADQALTATIAKLRDGPISQDLLDRAREPYLASFDNMLKSNQGWLALADRAQSEADRLARTAAIRERAEAVTVEALQADARRWLPEGGALTFFVLPEGVPSPISIDPPLARTSASP